MEAINRDRVSRLQEEMSRRGVEWLWIEPSVGFFYLTGLEPISMERLTGLIVPSEGALRLLVPLMLRDECASIDAEVEAWTDGEGPEPAAGRVVKDVKRLHVQGSLPAWALMMLRSVKPELEVELDPGALSSLRERKDAHEIELIERSAAVSDEMVEWIGTIDLEGMTERALGGLIQARYLELGHRPTPDPLVASGANASMPHYSGEESPIRRDAPLLLDIGCALEGYWSDITRVYLPSHLDSEIEKAYEIVCAGYDAAFARVEPGVPCQEVDRAARTVITEAGYGDQFVHRTGHGLGLEMHEAPYIRDGNDRPLEIGHVFSIEPGIYVSGRFGVRFENIVYLSEGGPVSVNDSPRVHHFSQ
jgi:Xaa-Pro aminopeptidase